MQKLNLGYQRPGAAMADAQYECQWRSWTTLPLPRDPLIVTPLGLLYTLDGVTYRGPEYYVVMGPWERTK